MQVEDTHTFGVYSRISKMFFLITHLVTLTSKVEGEKEGDFYSLARGVGAGA